MTWRPHRSRRPVCASPRTSPFLPLSRTWMLVASCPLPPRDGPPIRGALAGRGPGCVTSGRAVADLTDHSTASYIALNTNGGNSFEVVSDPSAPNGYDPQIVGIGIVAKNTALIDTVQKALQALIDEGAYQKIVAKYGLLPVQSAMVNQGGASPSPSATP